MATGLLPIQPVIIKACASTSSNRKPDTDQRRSGASSKWWSPIFGFSTEPDYIENKPGSDPDLKPVKANRFNPGSFTEDKAKQLRRLTTETASFHDIMYHSAIASRLASDFNDQNGL